jgi:hypothetical protein
MQNTTFVALKKCFKAKSTKKKIGSRKKKKKKAGKYSTIFHMKRA